jgi:hypothetical protein
MERSDTRIPGVLRASWHAAGGPEALNQGPDHFLSKVVNMTDLWYYGSGANKLGPFSTAQLKEFVTLGKLQPTDTVWKKGIEKGVLAERVKNLFPPVQAEARSANGDIPVADAQTASLEASQDVAPLLAAPAPATGSLLQQAGQGNQGGATAKLEPWLNSTPYPVTPGVPLQAIIPDGLRLKGMSEQSDPVLPVAPVPTEAADRKLKVPAYTRPRTPDVPGRRGRAVAVKGAVITSQDGAIVQYRKRCNKCGHESASRSSRPIRNGMSRERFFCPKCRKMTEVVIQGIV